MPSTRWLLVSILVGCGGGAATPDAAAPDAPVDAAPDAMVDADPDAPDLTCLGQAPPSVAPDPLPVGGKLFGVDHYDVAPLAGAKVVLRARVGDASIAEATTGTDGAFAMSVASGGAPVDGYFTVDVAGFVPSRIDPGDPLSGSEDALLLVAAPAELARWYADAGTAAPGGAVITATVDCRRAAIAGSTVAVTGGTRAAYYDPVAKRWDPALASSGNGFTLLTGSALAVTASSGAATFPVHAVAAPPDTLAITVLTPRARQ